MSGFVRKEICEGVTFNSIVDRRFKVGRLSATLITPLNRSTAAANALLSCVLTRSCRKYPDFTALNRRLNALYGAALYPTVQRIGDFQAITIAASGLDDRYTLDGESVFSELAELLCDMIFEPKLENGQFNAEDVEQERRQLLEDIDAEYNDKRTYAINRCIEKMCRDELFAIGRAGSREDVTALTQENLLAAWKTLLDKARIEIAMLGSADPERVYERFCAYLSGKPRKLSGKTKIVTEVGEVRRIVETDEIAQSKLVMGYRCAYPENNRQIVAASLMSAILGGTPTSKLFANVREKQSLCYYCASRFDKEKGLLLIDSGVETDNITKTEEAVTEQVGLLKKGEISDEEMIAAKLAVRNAYLSALDSLASMQSFFIGGVLRSDPLTPAEAAELVESITKEEILELASQIKLDMVFSLVGN